MQQGTLPTCGCYYGSGILYAAVLPTDDGSAINTGFDFSPALQQLVLQPAWVDLGEVSGLSIDIETAQNKLPRYDGKGGTDAATETFVSASVNLTMHTLCTANLSLALAANITDLPLPYILGNESWGYDWGNNWGFNPSGYYPQGVLLQQLNALSKQYRPKVALLYVGRNHADGSGVIVHIPTVKLGIAKRRPIISDDIESIALSGTVLYTADTTPTPTNWWREIYTT